MRNTNNLSNLKGYDGLLGSIKERIRTAQIKAGLAVNRELVSLYWKIGRDIVARQKQLGWGAKVIDKLSVDLHRAFPDMQGFSSRNLKYMRSFALMYSDEPIVQQLAAQIPWFHNCLLIDRVKDANEREWYIQKTIEHGWSRPILEHQIETGLYRRQGKAVTNFRHTLPPSQSDLAQQVVKDPYNFDFLTLTEEADRLIYRGGSKETTTSFR
jgi:predicted nuclease of restriction endonuclease-like (RecB) superfamily